MLIMRLILLHELLIFYLQLSPVHSRPSSLVGQQEREAIHVFNTIRRYNEDIRKAKENGPDAAPPLPLKKKTGKGSFSST